MVSEDREYVDRVLAGDSEAFEGLVRKYKRLGGAIAFGVLGDLDLAEDVVQDSFLRAYCSLENLRKPERFRLWFSGIVKKRSIDVLRQQRARQEAGLRVADVESALPGNSVNPVDRLLEKERKRKVLDAMAELPVDDRLVLVLKHMEGLSYKEISEVTDASVSSVESRLFRARKALKEKLTHRINSDS